jgi:hypothetical protein
MAMSSSEVDGPEHERAVAQRTPKTIPALPCVSIDQTLDFWSSLGFAITYRQKAPNPYGVVKRDGYELHFFGLEGLDPAKAFSTCFVKLPEVEGLHAEFAERLGRTLGRSPAKGLPRISRMRPGQTRFTLTDPNGSSVIFIKYGREDERKAHAYEDPTLTPLQRSIKFAERVRDYHVDDHLAAKTLDVALARRGVESPLDRAEALAARAELARALDDPALAERLEAEALVLKAKSDDSR